MLRFEAFVTLRTKTTNAVHKSIQNQHSAAFQSCDHNYTARCETPVILTRARCETSALQFN